MATQISKNKRKFVADAAFYAELEEILTKELATEYGYSEYGYSGVDVRDTPIRTENIIKPTPTQNVVGEENKGVDISCSKENQMSSGQS